MDEEKVSRAPKSGEDYEQSECSTDPRKYHLLVRYRTYTAGRIWRGGKKMKLNTISTAQLGKDKFCFCCSLPSVCIEKHSREHQLHTTPLPALEPLLSSKRDPYKVLLQHTTPDPLETGVPVVLKDKRANMINKKNLWASANVDTKDYRSINLRPIGASLFLSDFSNSAFFR